MRERPDILALVIALAALCLLPCCSIMETSDDSPRTEGQAAQLEIWQDPEETISVPEPDADPNGDAAEPDAESSQPAAEENDTAEADPADNAGEDASAVPVGRMDTAYAEQFTVDYYADGSALLTIAGRDRFLILSRGQARPAHDADAEVIFQPVERMYLAASSAMDLVFQIDAESAVPLTSTRAAEWALPEVRAAMEAGSISYAGKYSAPDYELLLSEGVDLAVESTMIYHSPQVQEKLRQIGIPVLVERSSYEPHPLGRVEWIKVYGLLTGRLADAERFFQRELDILDGLGDPEPTGKRAAFFYIHSGGAAVVRKSGDYVARMMELAGGEYAFSNAAGEDNALSTTNLQLESFFAVAKDADILIYNSTIDGGVKTIADLLEKSPLFAQCKAVQSGDVWCTEQNLFQETSAIGDMIAQLHAIFTGEDDLPGETAFFHRLT